MQQKFSKLFFRIGILLLFLGSNNLSLQAQTYDIQMYNLLRSNVQAFRDMMNADPNLTVNLRGADLSGMNLSGIRFSGSNLSYTNLVGTNLKECNLGGTDFIGAKMMNANLERSTLNRANLDRANVTGASFKDSDFHNAQPFNMLIQIGNELFPAQITNGIAVPLGK